MTNVVRTFGVVALSVVAATFVFAAPAAGAAPRAAANGFGVLAAGFVPSTTGNPVNDHRQVAGSVRAADGTTRPAVYDLGTGTVVRLQRFAGANAVATDVNNHGLVSGHVQTASGSRAFVWSLGGGRVRVLNRASLTESTAYAINDDGIVVGSATVGGQRQGLRWRPSQDHYRLLPDLDAAAAINDRGWIVGSRLEEVAGRLVAVPKLIRPHRTLITLPLLPGDDSAVPSAIDDAGRIGGYSYSIERDDLINRPVLWRSAAMVPCQLGTARGNSAVAAISDRGPIVGIQNDYFANTYAATVWRGCHDSGTALPSDGYTLPQATGVDHRGRIVGQGNQAGIAVGLVWRPA